MGELCGVGGCPLARVRDGWCAWGRVPSDGGTLAESVVVQGCECEGHDLMAVHCGVAGAAHLGVGYGIDDFRGEGSDAEAALTPWRWGALEVAVDRGGDRRSVSGGQHGCYFERSVDRRPISFVVHRHDCFVQRVARPLAAGNGSGLGECEPVPH